MSFPSGTVTFLFTDIEGSTRLLQTLGDEYGRVLADQRRILRENFGNWQGREVDTQGDAFFVSFPRAGDALGAVVAAQLAMEAHDWPGGVRLRVRMGLHTGEPEMGEDGYVGMAVHRAARLAHAGHGGQVLLSETTEALIRDDLPKGVGLENLGEFQLKDLSRPENIYQLVIPDLPGEFPPLAVEALARTNLPEHLTTFIGRQDALAEVKDLLERERLVSLIGPGGVGKTRLSQQAGGETITRFADGVWLVELAPLSDPARVPQIIAQCFELRETANKQYIDALLDYLEERQLLLILDNCEHVIEACAQFAGEILQTCPEVSILTTSREILGVAGEAIYAVPSLQVVAPELVTSPQDLREVESIRLFEERAVAASPGFEINPNNVGSIAQICQRLDGIPLAIELAAARVRVLSPQQIADRLNNSFSLLTGGDRTALPRQQTLRATIDWSHDLLTEQEQVLFRRLAVFVGGWTLEAAEAVCGGAEDQFADQLESFEVLDLLANLVDKSLVIKSEHGDTARYHRLEIVRQYAIEKLQASSEEEILRNAHLDWFASLAEEAASYLDGEDQLSWLEQLDEEYDNFNAAMDWSQQDEIRALRGLELSVSLRSFWSARGNFTEGRQRLSSLLTLAEALAPPDMRAWAMSGAADLAYQQSDYSATRDLNERSLAIFRSLGPDGRRGVADNLIGLGNVATEVGDYESAPGLFEEGLKIMRELGDQTGIGNVLRNLGWCAMRPGDYDLAEVYLEEALDVYRQIGVDLFGITATLAGLGEVALRKGEYSRAEERLHESLEISRELGIHWRTAASLGSLGWISLRQGDAARTRAYLAESLEIRLKLGDQGGTAWCLEKLAELLGTEDRFEDQVKMYGTAAALRTPLNSVIDPADQPEYERTIAGARQTLGDAPFETAWKQGQSLSVEEAIVAGLTPPG